MVTQQEEGDEHLRVLVGRALEDDQEACEEIYRMHVNFVTRVVRRYLDFSYEVEDVVQETFVAAFRSMAHLSDQNALRAWLRTVAMRSSMRVLRRRYVQKEELCSMSHEEPSTTDVARTALAQELYWALGELPSKLRRPWVSLRIKGQGFFAVAEELELSESTVKRRIREADARLRRRLDSPAACSAMALMP